MGQAAAARRVWRLPAALPDGDGGVPRGFRIAWGALLALVVAIQLAAFAYVLFDAYRIDPAFHAVGLATDFDDRSRPVVTPLRADTVQAGVTTGDRIVAIAGRGFAPDASVFTLGRALIAAPGDAVALAVRKPDGRIIRFTARRSATAPIVVTPNPIPLNVRMGIRLFFTLLCSLALIGSSWLLLRRRAHDPLAFLLGIGFLGIAASVDPPLLLWMSIGIDWMIDVLTGLWWTVFVVALAAFPDGRFTPSWLRWSLIVAPVLGLVLIVDRLSELSSLLLGVGIPLLLLLAQVIRYRRLAPGLERQQIKWAALGFSAGFVIVGAALGMSMADYDSWPATTRAYWLLATVCLFNLGFAIMPLGLLVSIMRYRLWDVDQIISRSVAYTLLTGGIVLFWTLMSDVAKQIVSSLMGPDHAVLGLALGVIIAVGVFVPTQKLVLQWSKRRFNPSRVALERLPERLREWRTRYDAAEVASRALGVAMRSLHAPSGAVLARTPTGRTLLARQGEDATDAPLSAKEAAANGAHVLHLEDTDGLEGWLILAPRDDGSRFPKSDLHALAAAGGTFARALRMAEPPDRREAALRTMLDEVQQRLARLEQTSPRSA